MKTKEDIRPIHIDQPHLVLTADTDRLRSLARELIREGKPEQAELVLRATVAASPDDDEGVRRPVAISAKDRAAMDHKLVVDYLAVEHNAQDFDRFMRGEARWPETDEERLVAADDAGDAEALLPVARHLIERGSHPWAEVVARRAALIRFDPEAVRLWAVIEDDLEVGNRFTWEERRRELDKVYHIDTGMVYHHDCPACPEHRAEAGDEFVDFDAAQARFAQVAR